MMLIEIPLVVSSAEKFSDTDTEANHVHLEASLLHTSVVTLNFRF